MLGGAGAEDFVAGSLSSCFTVSVGGSGSFFTSTATKEHAITGKLMDFMTTKLLLFTPSSKSSVYTLNFKSEISERKDKHNNGTASHTQTQS